MKKLYTLILAIMLSISATAQPCTVTFTTSGTWICPAGVTSITVECWGGAGGGGIAYCQYSGDHAAAGGGGGGAYAASTISVIPGNSYAISVGSGGDGHGNSATTSSFSSNLVVADYGKNGGNAYQYSGGILFGSGAAGGSITNSIGAITYAGGNGTTGEGAYNSGAGGGGAGSTGNGGNASSNSGYPHTGGSGTTINGGNGANGTNCASYSVPGNNGGIYGGAGSGGNHGSSPGTSYGGSGGSGFVQISYIPGVPATPIGPSQICFTTTTTVYTNSVTNATAYSWEIIPSSAGTISGTDTSAIINWNILFTGNAKITVSGTDTCSPGIIYTGASSDTLTINVVANSTTPIISNNSPVCTGNTLLLTASTISGATYSWSGPNGFTSTQQNPTVSTNVTTAMAGNYNVTFSANGCTSSAYTTTVIINQATANNNGPVCEGSTLSLTASAIPSATYFWTGPNSFTSTSQNPTVSTSASSVMVGVYSVYSTANGCTSPTPGTTTVVVNPIPNTPTAGNNGPVGIGNPLSLVASTITGATYSWIGPNSFTSTQQNPTVSSSATSAMGGVYNVTSSVNGCTSIAGTTSVEINKITASNNGPVCTGSTLSLSATSITGATYSWTGPNSFISSQQNPTVSTSTTTAMAGVYNVTSTVNGCTSPSSVTIVSIITSPSAPTVTSPVTYCQNIPSSPLSATGSSLLWYTTPTGGTGSSTAPTPSTSVAGTTVYYVSQTVGCESQRDSISVFVNPIPASAGIISGTATVCQGQSSVIYTVPIITNATSYVWALPSGATGTSTTNSITVNYGTSAASGNIIVKGNNSCGDGAISTLAITVNPLPVAAGTITGNATVCQGQNSVTYTVPTITNATSYVWSLPSGATGTSATNSINVNFGISASSGNITVKGNNSCGDGTFSSSSITINPLPISAGTISGTATVCQGQNSVTYTVPTITNATSYTWTLPTGATGTSITNSITANYGGSAVSGNISVKGHNTCGDGAANSLYIAVVPKPNANAGNDTIICTGSSIILTATGGSTYTWNNSVTQGVPFTPASTNTYTVTVSNGFCTATDNIIITVATPPSAPVIYQTGNDLNSTSSTGNQWYNDSGIITGATSQIFTPTATSHYYSIVTDVNGCISDTSNIIYVLITSLSNLVSSDGNIYIYPNPANTLVTIDISDFSANSNNTIQLLDINGKLLKYIQIKESKTLLNISDIAAGVYIIKITKNNGIIVRSLIKEK